MPDHGRRGPFLTHIAIDDFRSIRSAQVPLGPLTIIVGRNGAGKSNIVTAIRRCSQVARVVLDWLPMDDSGADTCDVPGLETAKTSVFHPTDLYRLSKDRKAEIRLSVGTVAGRTESPGCIELSYLPEADRPFESHSAEGGVDPTDRGKANLYRFVANASWISMDRMGRWELEAPPVDREQGEFPVWHEVLASMDRECIPGRGISLRWIGSELFGIEWGFPSADDYGPTEDGFGPAQFTDQVLGDRAGGLPYRLMSLGTRQAIPVFTCLVAMANSREGGVLLTEEPEVSLHPKTQVRVGEYMAMFASVGVQSIFTTHSHYLLLGMSKAVREGVLPPDDVVVLDCAKGADGTTVTRRPVDHLGRIEGWIPSFTEVDDDLFEHWVKSMPEAN